jgi:D-serine deaminase-like pyridoxal phosphate-dependent protein
MDAAPYSIKDTARVCTPALVYYKDIIIANIEKTIQAAGGVQRMWPHVKTHKMAAVVQLQQKAGIQRFKCATVAEAEMLALCEARDILLAYPLVGPNIDRYISLAKKYPHSRFWALGDDAVQTALLAAASKAAGIVTPFLVDVDIGMNRTGAPLESAETFFIRCAALEGLELKGLHCFNGNYKITDPLLRKQAVEATGPAIPALRERLHNKGLDCSVVIVGSTPSLPCYASYEDVFVSPGTSFITDYNYYTLFPDLNFLPGAVLLSRVISRNGCLFTLDLGYKAIAADPKDLRGIILGLEEASPVFHCEEHWAFQVPPDKQALIPQIGTLLYVVPAHICPTTALFPSVLVAADGKIEGEWEVSARNRKITV